jgi:hypothetical protein
MKLRIRGNSLRLRVSRTELLQIAEQGSAEDSIRFAPGTEWRYGIDVKPAGDVAAQFAANSLRVVLPKARVEQWLDDRGRHRGNSRSATESAILVEKDYTCPRRGPARTTPICSRIRRKKGAGRHDFWPGRE